MTSVDGIAGKTIKGTLYNGVAAAIAFVLSFLRTIFMARLLLPEHFGVVALAFFFVHTINLLLNFGLSSAFIHCQNHSETLKQTYFSIQCILLGIKAIIIICISPLLQSLYPNILYLQELLIILVFITTVTGISMIQITLLRKEMAFSSLAVMEVTASVVTLIVGPITAWVGWGVWALVAERASNAFVQFILVWGPFRSCSPRFGWNQQDKSLFLRFAQPTWIRMNLEHLLDRFDDFWIGSSVGQIALGFYDKAYYFACAPRRIVALPLVKVFEPVYAHFQDDRKLLSQSFQQSAYLLIRMVFLGAGWFAVIIPEFIQLVIGAKWLPMLWTFRFLLLYAALDSFRVLLHNLLNAIGRPTLLRNTAILQTLFFLPAVILGAHWGGINGVALAADAMLLLGIMYLYGHLRKFIDLHPWRIFGWPFLALIVAIGIGYLIEVRIPESSWTTLFLKSVAFVAIFGCTLILIEGKNYYQQIIEIKTLLKSSK